MGILQSVLAPFLNFGSIHPDLVVVIVLGWSILKNFTEAVTWAFIGGVILDVLTSPPFGVFTVSFLLTAILINFWHSRLSDSTLLLPILFALPYTMFFNLCNLLFLQVLGYTIAWGSAVRTIIFPAGLMNVAAMALIFPILSWLNQFSRKDDLTI